jgi:TRAP-type mannitol/chloroaromatic compound transport system permease small subunit
MRVAAGLERAFQTVVTVCNTAASAIIFIVACYMTASVLGTFLVNKPVPGTVGFAKVMLPMIVFLSITYTLRSGGHVRTGVLYDRLGAQGKAIIDIVNGVLGVAAFATISYYSAKLAYASWVTRDFLDGVLRVPVYPTRFAILLGSVTMTIEFALQTGRSLVALSNPGRLDTG